MDKKENANSGHWTVGFNDEYINIWTKKGLIKSPVSKDSLSIGDLIFFYEEFGVGLVLKLNKRESRCLIYWSKEQIPNKTMWHNTFTILGQLARNSAIGFEGKKAFFVLKSKLEIDFDE